MPELAEVECMRRRWEAGAGAAIEEVLVHPPARVFRGCQAQELQRALAGARFLESQRSGKRMMFRFDRGWMGLHLGMSGELLVKPPAATTIWFCGSGRARWSSTIRACSGRSILPRGWILLSGGATVRRRFSESLRVREGCMW